MRLSVSEDVKSCVIGEVELEGEIVVGTGGRGPEGEEAGVGRDAFRALGEPGSRREDEREGGCRCVDVGLCGGVASDDLGTEDLVVSRGLGVIAPGVAVLNEEDDVVGRGCIGSRVWLFDRVGVVVPVDP